MAIRLGKSVVVVRQASLAGEFFLPLGRATKGFYRGAVQAMIYLAEDPDDPVLVERARVTFIAAAREAGILHSERAGSATFF